MNNQHKKSAAYDALVAQKYHAQHKNFETLYKKKFHIETMPTIDGRDSDYIDQHQREAWMYFKEQTNMAWWSSTKWVEITDESLILEKGMK